MHTIQKECSVKWFPPLVFIVSLPTGNYKQHFRNSFQTFFMFVSHLSPFYTNKTYLLFLPSNISWECFIGSTHSVYRLHAIPCIVALQFICSFFKLVNIWISHKIFPYKQMNGQYCSQPEMLSHAGSVELKF